jgi:mono/diheme cytochrome c family protein
MRPGTLAGIVMAIAGAAAPPAAQQRTITLPPETAVYVASDLPGYRLVQKNCVGCHSADYVRIQPPASARAWWDATVKKMKKPFGAAFPDEDIGAMLDYLVKTYGAERATTPANGRGAPPRREPSTR